VEAASLIDLMDFGRFIEKTNIYSSFCYRFKPFYGIMFLYIARCTFFMTYVMNWRGIYE